MIKQRNTLNTRVAVNQPFLKIYAKMSLPIRLFLLTASTVLTPHYLSPLKLLLFCYEQMDATRHCRRSQCSRYYNKSDININEKEITFLGQQYPRFAAWLSYRQAQPFLIRIQPRLYAPNWLWLQQIHSFGYAAEIAASIMTFQQRGDPVTAWSQEKQQRDEKACMPAESDYESPTDVVTGCLAKCCI